MPSHNDLTHVVDRTAFIENILSQIIWGYCGPRKDRFMFFWSVVLDSSVMPMGSKVKVAMAIAQKIGFNLDQNALHSVLSLRNAFAHQPTNSHPVLVVGRTEDQSAMHLQLQILSNSGKISMKRRQDALEEFNKVYSVSKASLIDLLEQVNQQRVEGAA